MKIWIAASILILSTTAYKQVPFEPYTGNIDPSSVFEQFNYESLGDSPWIVSAAKREDGFYRGRWSIDEPYKYPGFKGDKGLVTQDEAVHQAVSYKFDTPFENIDDTLVIQYEVKNQKEVSCGGAYLKLLNAGFDPKNFSSETPFQVMFGPDKCGADDKIHLIINKLNPISQTYEEKHYSQPPLTRSTQLTVLHTLILRPNGEFEIRLDGGVVKAGNILEQPELLKPRLNPPKMIEVANTGKPDDWDDEEFIVDELAEKPADYDEVYGNMFIADPEYPKPDGWLDDEPEYIVDPFAKRPEEWDDAEDGEWKPPAIKNPKCLPGCGKWEPRLIPNKDYVGPWSPPLIPNPNYQGEWVPEMKENPNYYEDTKPFNFHPIGGIGFDLWALHLDTIFDNIYVGHSVEEAERIGNATFVTKHAQELESYEETRPKPVKPPAPPPKSFEEILRDEETSGFNQVWIFFFLIFKREFLSMKDFWFDFNRNPVATLSQEPLKAFVYSGVFLLVFTISFAVLNVFAFLLTSWASSAKKSVDAAKKQLEEDTEPQEPKIVELDSDSEETTTTSTQTKQTSAVKRR